MKKLTGPVVVVVDHISSDTQPVLALESVGFLALAEQITSGPVIAVSALPQPDVAALGRSGVATVYAPDADISRLPFAIADLTQAAVAELESEPVAVFLSATHVAHEASARLAVLLGSAVTIDVTDLEVEDDHLVASKAVLGGQWVTRYLVGDHCPIISLAARVEAKAQGTSTTPQVTTLPTPSSQVEIISSTRDAGDGSVDLASATAVVVGGRGVDGNFDLVRDLAANLNGTVGATRVACDEDWVDRSLQVGQTGVAVSPDIYVGLGVSGAIHHTCGIQGSKVIVAVCDDPDAPIFDLVDFGVVGDVSEVVPQAIEEMTRIREEG